MSRLYFAAKAPIAGQVKTRLGAKTGMQAAATLYSAFLRDLVTRFADAPFEIAWHVAPDSWQHLEPLVGRADAVRIQRGRDWAARQSNLFRDCDASGEGRVVLAATDSPQLERTRVEEAFAALGSHDLVFGPTWDGGYYLIGMRRFNDIFAGASMSTDSTLDGVLDHARGKGLSVSLLETEFDVDTDQDLSLLEHEVTRREDLAYTAAALALMRSTGARIA